MINIINTKKNTSGILYKIVPEKNPLKYLEDKDYKVAVIGSSPVLLNNKYGKFIDSHDIIIRFNYVPTKKYEEFVGSKTSIRIMGRYWLPTDELYNNEIVIHRYNSSLYLKKDYKNLNLLKKYNVISFHNDFLKFIRKKYNIPGTPTSGFMGIAFAIYLFNKISILGFNPPKKDGDKYHYWNDNKKFISKSHPFDFEYNLIKKISQEHKLIMYD